MSAGVVLTSDAWPCALPPMVMNTAEKKMRASANNAAGPARTRRDRTMPFIAELISG